MAFALGPRASSAGYKLVETHSLYGKTAAEMRALLDKNGLRSVSGHYPLAELESSPDTVFAALSTEPEPA